ncbi:hypothetical protein F2Q68_00031160 [Brassica cretica]|uniref:Uncharacterized protein n=1 Tax=Brassica cretica TaxID=69181 RepID=A0A8S9GBG7_BRACR|nr:hypothetical protein F2Q68_00031160 [Brassica cretica]
MTMSRVFLSDLKTGKCSSSDESVTLSLFDCQAVSFHKKLESMRDDPNVVVDTNINPKMIGGRFFLNATSGKHVHFDKETNAEICLL